MAGTSHRAADRPDFTLTQLEDEPLNGFFGCTQTEMVGALRRAIFIWLGSSVLLVPFIFWAFAAIGGIPIAIFIFMRQIRRMSALREGKPLYYHRHVATYRSRRFIQPEPRYQIARRSR